VNNNNNEEDIDALLSELKEKNSQLKKFSNDLTINKDNIEQFILDSAGRLIKHSLEIIDNMKPGLEAAPDHKDISSYSELVTATTNAIESLNKIVITDKKSQTLKDIKKMSIESKSDENNTVGSRLMISREEMFKKILEDAKVVDLVTEALPLSSN